MAGKTPVQELLDAVQTVRELAKGTWPQVGHEIADLLRGDAVIFEDRVREVLAANGFQDGAE